MLAARYLWSVSNNGVSSHRKGRNKNPVCYGAWKGSGELQKDGRKTERGMETKRNSLKKGGGGEGEMINPIKLLSVSSIAIVLRWLPFPQLTVGCS